MFPPLLGLRGGVGGGSERDAGWGCCQGYDGGEDSGDKDGDEAEGGGGDFFVEDVGEGDGWVDGGEGTAVGGLAPEDGADDCNASDFVGVSMVSWGFHVVYCEREDWGSMLSDAQDYDPVYYV